MRQTYTMTDEQYAKLLRACRPVPYLVAGGMEPPSQQANANAAWQELGRQLGFDWETVKPGGEMKQFTAEPTS